MSITNLRSWLRRNAEATASFKVGDLDLAIPDGRSKWAELESTIEAKAKRGDSIEAYDEEGTLLRAFTWEGGDAAASEGPAAKGPLPMNENALVHSLAALLERAADRGAERHAGAYTMAFDTIRASQADAFATMVNLVNLVSNRLVAMETAWGKAMVATAEARAEAVAARAEGQQGDVLDRVMPMLVEAGMAGMKKKVETVVAGPNGAKANGKKVPEA